MLSTAKAAFLPAANGFRQQNSDLPSLESWKTCKSQRFNGNVACSIANRVPFFALGFRGSNREVTFRCSAQSGNQLPSSDPSPGSWKIWVVGVIISAALAFWKKNWVPFLRIEREVKVVVERAEEVASKIEEIAEDVEKVAEEVAEQLPEGGKLRDEVTYVENVAELTAKDARLAQQILEKIEEVEEKVENLANEANQAARGAPPNVDQN
ncbi:hypothetical protein SAY87_032058 [Trapa incisa]|uniref:Plastid-targeted protein 4 n=1 Tax=Trapa incisa TaxID=236973 RepID=A0AAN7QMG7_9MYRT|nr:hypothetical protein SAY87_032058 [Trapa incisa]